MCKQNVAPQFCSSLPALPMATHDHANFPAKPQAISRVEHKHLQMLLQPSFRLAQSARKHHKQLVCVTPQRVKASLHHGLPSLIHHQQMKRSISHHQTYCIKASLPTSSSTTTQLLSHSTSSYSFKRDIPSSSCFPWTHHLCLNVAENPAPLTGRVKDPQELTAIHLPLDACYTTNPKTKPVNIHEQALPFLLPVSNPVSYHIWSGNGLRAGA